MLSPARPVRHRTAPLFPSADEGSPFLNQGGACPTSLRQLERHEPDLSRRRLTPNLCLVEQQDCDGLSRACKRAPVSRPLDCPSLSPSRGRQRGPSIGNVAGPDPSFPKGWQDPPVRERERIYVGSMKSGEIQGNSEPPLCSFFFAVAQPNPSPHTFALRKPVEPGQWGTNR